MLPRLSRIQLSPRESRDMTDSLMFLADILSRDGEQDTSLRDPADQQILATLRASGADYLITGDKDLLALAATYPIVTPAMFLAKHG